jgi:hypothetical protein
MKSKLFFLSVICLSALGMKAQPYAGITVGYGLPGSWSVLGHNIESNKPANTFSNENVKGSYGTGLNFGGYFGDMLADDIGLELGVNYLMGWKYKFTDHNVMSPGVIDNTEQEIYARSLRLCPSLRIEFGDWNARPYMRAGIAIGIMNKLIDNSTETFTNPGTTDVALETFERRGGVSIGFTGALGIGIPVNDNMFFFAEVCDYNMNWAPAKGEITVATLNGADELGGMTTDEKEFEYVDMVDQTMNTASSQPTKQLKTYFPMSSFGINVGLHFAFGG